MTSMSYNIKLKEALQGMILYFGSVHFEWDGVVGVNFGGICVKFRDKEFDNPNNALLLS